MVKRTAAKVRHLSQRCLANWTSSLQSLQRSDFVVQCQIVSIGTHEG